MADNKKIYTIQINGIDQSIKQVDALSDALQFLDRKIKDLESRSVSVTSSNNGGGGNRTAELNAEDKLLKQIQSTEQQIRDARREDYQSLLAQKDILKDIVSEAQERAAAERLSSGNYGNNMKGLKQELSDIKKVMQTTDLGDEKFQELTQRANELTNKLKELEVAYGQFGRNVGNYPGTVGEGFSKLQIEVNGTTREFDNARQALKELTNERNTLKLMGQDFGDLDEVVKTLKSDIKDMEMSSAAMDGLLDSMEGLIALGSSAEGFAALFGFDNGAIEQTIQKLVALQNILQGIEVIKKQMQTGEGIGGLFAKGNAAIDKFSASLLGVSNNAKAANAGLKTTAAAVTTVGTASKAATIAVKALSLALKTIGIGLIITAIAYLTEAITDWLSKESEAEKAAKRMAEVNQAGAKAYANAAGEMQAYKSKLDNFNGSKKQEKALVDELNNKYGKALGNYKSLKEWKDVIINKSDAYCTALLKEAEAQALLNQYTEAFVELQTVRDNVASGEYHHWWQTAAGDAAADAEEISKAEKNVEQAMDRYKAKMQEINQYNKTHKLFDYSNYADTKEIKNSGAKIGKTIKDVEADLAKARVDAMKQGLTKTLAQLELERNKRIAEAKKTGKLVQEQIELINKQYQDKVFEARVQYHVNLINEEKKYVEKIENLNEEMYQKEVEISRKRNELRLENDIDNMTFKKAVDSTTLSDGDVVDMNALYERGLRNLTYDYNFELPPKILRQYKDLADELDTVNIVMDELDTSTEEGAKEFEEYAQKAQDITNKLKEFGEKYPQIAIEAEKLVATTLDDAILERTAAIEGYYQAVLGYTQDAADKELVIEKDKLETELRLLEENEKKRHQIAISRYYDDDEKNEAETKRRNSLYNTPRTAFETYMEEDTKGNLLGKNSDQLGKYFSEYRKLMDEWVDSFKKDVDDEKITWEEYLEFMNQEAIQGYLKAKTEYENFLTQYNAMSDSEKAKNEKNLKKLTRNLNNSYVDYLDKIREEQQTHENQKKVIENKYNVDVEQAEKEHQKRMRQATVDYHSQMISEYERAMSAISNKVDKAETKNAWGIINYGATKNALKDLQESINTTISKIEADKRNLVTELAEGKISFGDFSTLMDQLNSLEVQSQDTAKNVSTKLKNLLGDFWGSIDQWVQQVGQTMNTILSSLSEIQSNQYDKMIEQQEKYIEEYENLLDKQKDITQEHASAVESIEDELSTARGDRRQQLIDQLNAEMAAQRASLAQEQKIERQKQKAEEKKKKLEHDQAVAKKKMQLAQAAINMAMAISMAAVNSWPIPAIPMMALAAAAGAAQIAAIQSQNIPSYGSGGVIQGKSHREGGVKVLGGQAEVEGGEFITNKVTTSKNVDLLEYINTKRRKIKLEDLIDFYGGNSQVKKSITTVRTKFADGGTIPTLRNDINLSDRMLTAFEDYSNRPVQVAVVDIIDRTQAVNDVRVMAGLE